MYEKRHQPLASQKKFRKRIVRVVIIDICILVFSLGIGIIGYHIFAGLDFVESFYNASMILGGMGPAAVLDKNNGAMFFAGCYALFSGITFLSAFAILSAPILHRFLHKFHIEEGKDS